MKEQLEMLIKQMHGGGIIYQEAVREVKKLFIMQVIKSNKGNLSRSARELGMHRNTLTRTLSELKMAAETRELGYSLKCKPAIHVQKQRPLEMEA